MSEQAPEGGGGGKKILGMDRRTAGFVGLALAAGIIWYFVKSRRSAAAATAPAADASGTPTDFSGEISTLQSEFGSLASEVAAQQGTTGPAGPAGPAGPSGPPGPEDKDQPPFISPPSKPPAKKPPPPKKPPPKNKPPRQITIVRGDTLSELAAKYHTTVAELLKLNPSIRNPNLIYAGSKLNVPG